MINPRNPDYRNTPASPERPSFDYSRRDPNHPPVVTIVTPFHNPGEVFLETVTSVLRQSLPHWEWLVVDDASTDPRSLELLAELAAREARVRVIRNEEKLGPSGARNLGLEQAQCDRVMLLDADDLIEPTCLEVSAWVLATDEQAAFVKGFSVGFGALDYLWKHGFHSGADLLANNTLTVTSMIRRSVWEAVGRFDSTIQSGCEDWEFWIRSASRGHWGRTVPEFLDWYRRRSDHHLKWKQWDQGARQEAFGEQLRRSHAHLNAVTFPRRPPASVKAFQPARRRPPIQNPLAKETRRLLMIVPWFQLGGADKFNLRVLQQLKARGFEVTVVATVPSSNSWIDKFTALTPDVFVIDHFLSRADAPVFLRYLIESRQPDVVMLANSELGYWLLPYLRSVCPAPVFVDFVHMEEEEWKSGGHPRSSVGMQDQLDLCIVSSEHLRGWMTERGADPERIAVCYTNESTSEFHPDPIARARRRAELNVDEEVPVILFAGRICPQKQPHVLARVIARLVERKLNFLAIVVGDGEGRPWLEKFIRTKGLETRMRLLGALSNDETREMMAASDLFFLPSQWEGIALSFYEAMAMELPVVGADVGGQKELVTQEVGELLQRGTEDQEVDRYADALEALIRSPELRDRKRKAARLRIAEHFELEAMGDRLVALFERARALRTEAPRMALSEGLANEMADRAVEYFRLEDELDLERRGALKGVPHDPTEIIEELSRIETSRTFQLIEQTKRLWPYRVFARHRWGENWMEANPLEAPALRLARIKNSRSFRAVERIKKTGAFRWYVARNADASDIP